MEEAGSTQGTEKSVKVSVGKPEERERLGIPDNRRE
jgi:hypothetical protein